MTLTWLYQQVHGRKAPRRSPRRWSDRKPPKAWEYRAWIRTLPSAVSGIEGPGLIEAAHTGSDGGTSMKASGYSCIPLTVEEHREYHQIGKASFEAKHGIDCRHIVRSLNRVWFKYAREVK